MPEDAATSRDFVDQLTAVWRRRWLVIGITALTLAAALVVSFLKPPVYLSTAKVLVKPTALNPPGSIPGPATIVMETEVEVVRSVPVGNIAADKLGGQAGALLSHISAAFPAGSQVLLISYAAGDPAAARDGAQAFAEAYLQYRADQAQREAGRAVQTAEQQTALLQRMANAAQHVAANAKPGSAVEVQASNRAAQLNGQIAIFEANISIINLRATDPGEVLVPAGLPVTPASPNHAQDAARGLLIGIVLGIAAALFRENVTPRPPAAT